MHYIHCPQCGQKLKDKQAGDDGLVPYCTACEKYWFDGFATCVIVLLYNEKNEIMLCKQHYLSEVYENFTSGYIHPGESAEETALREVKEELGITAQNLEFVGSYWFSKKEILMLGFIAFSPQETFTLSSEVNAARWAPVDEAPKTMFPETPGNAMWPLYRHFRKIKGI